MVLSLLQAGKQSGEGCVITSQCFSHTRGLGPGWCRSFSPPRKYFPKNHSNPSSELEAEASGHFRLLISLSDTEQEVMGAARMINSIKKKYACCYRKGVGVQADVRGSYSAPGTATPNEKCCHPGRTTKELDFETEDSGHSNRQKSLVINASSHDQQQMDCSLYPHVLSCSYIILVKNG